MLLKKSAVLLILLSASAIGLLVFSVSGKPQTSAPVKCVPSNSSNLIHEPGTFSTFDMIPGIMLRLAA